ncbi:MAG: YcjX family protein [Pseudomonadota bacterium]
MRLPDVSQTASDVLSASRRAIGDFASPTIRLGVTGLSRAGKTVFITALVRNLLEAHRLPAFPIARQGRLRRAYLSEQPDLNIPRFPYEANVEVLTADPPAWPAGTERMSQLRLTLEVVPQSTWGQIVGADQVHVDIVDYPGEWLLDLAIMDQSFGDWSAEQFTRLQRADHRAIASSFLAAINALAGPGPHDEPKIEAAATAFRDYLHAARALPPGLATLGPGRFLMPGDLAGSPMLTFAPLPPARADDRFDDTLRQRLSRRFEGYKDKVVVPFFRVQFAKLDRQIVLVDALGALNGGKRGLDDLREALTASLRAFRPGLRSWPDWLFGRAKIDKILYAATKADHIPQTSHARLGAILETLTAEASERAAFEGAKVGVQAMAAIRATSETVATVDGADAACITGTPAPGEQLNSETFDGRTETALFPGDLPADPRTAIRSAEDGTFDDLTFLRFLPPDLATSPSEPWPHGHLDKVLAFLLADKLP